MPGLGPRRTAVRSARSVGRALRAGRWQATKHKPRVLLNVYADPSLLDVAGALEALPDLPLTVHGGAAGSLAVKAEGA